VRADRLRTSLGRPQARGIETPGRSAARVPGNLVHCSRPDRSLTNCAARLIRLLHLDHAVGRTADSDPVAHRCECGAYAAGSRDRGVSDSNSARAWAVNGLHSTWSQVVPPHIGQRSGTARQLAPNVQAAHWKLNSGATSGSLRNCSAPISISTPRNSREGQGGRFVSTCSPDTAPGRNPIRDECYKLSAGTTTRKRGTVVERVVAAPVLPADSRPCPGRVGDSLLPASKRADGLGPSLSVAPRPMRRRARRTGARATVNSTLTVRGSSRRLASRSGEQK
jgi:hypothetical protein